MSTATAARVHAGSYRPDADPRRGFGSPREFLSTVMANAGRRDRGALPDERLRPLAVLDSGDHMAAGELAFLLPTAFTPRSIRAAAGSDEQGGYADRWGGFARPTSIAAPGLSRFEGDPTSGRTLAVPMGSPIVHVLAPTDQNHSTSVSGGLTVTRHPETVELPSSRMEVERVTLRAYSLVGLAYASDELMTDSPRTFAALIAAGFQDEMGATLLNEKLRGRGGPEFHGVLNSPAKITVPKETGQAAATIVSRNVDRMAGRCWGFDQGAIWLCNPDARPQIGTLPTFSGAIAEGFPNMLWGRPIYFTEFCEPVGTEGDLLLVNWSQYLEGLYQPLNTMESIHVRWSQHERALKFWLRNAGAPWWRAPLTPPGSSETRSPIITLADRS